MHSHCFCSMWYLLWLEILHPDWLVSWVLERGIWGCPYSTHKNMQDRLDKWRSASTETRLKILIDNHYKTIFESVRSACSSYTMWWRPATTLFPCGTSAPPPPLPRPLLIFMGVFWRIGTPPMGNPEFNICKSTKHPEITNSCCYKPTWNSIESHLLQIWRKLWHVWYDDSTWSSCLISHVLF